MKFVQSWLYFFFVLKNCEIIAALFDPPLKNHIGDLGDVDEGQAELPDMMINLNIKA